MKASIINIESTHKQDISLITVKQTLKSSLMDYEDRKRTETGNRFFCVYSHLHTHLKEGFADSTIRSWVNPCHEDSFADPVKLITLCNQIHDSRPAEALAKYLLIMTDSKVEMK